MLNYEVLILQEVEKLEETLNVPAKPKVFTIWPLKKKFAYF
jgi:hypothetical protein